MSGVTVRTLHYYDRIGLLVPSARSGRDYRLYTRDDLLRLQEILISRQLGLALEKIRAQLDDPGFDHRQALLDQRSALVQRVDETHAMIASIDVALKTLNEKETQKMDSKELFGGFNPDEHQAEAKARWGQTDAYREASQRSKQYGRDEWQKIRAEEAGILDNMAKAKQAGRSSDAEEVCDLAEAYRLHIDRWFYPCSHEMHLGLAEMYVADERFAAHFEKQGEGLTQFVAEAIRHNSRRS